MIELIDISKSYQMGLQTVHALRGVNATINEGEFVAIMGPSGSGKSTLMNIIGCLDLPTEGKYRLNGTDVSDMSDDEQARVRNRHIGFVFQRFNLLARAPALKQVMLPLMYMGISGSERTRRAERALDMVGLGERMDHKPEELSGGQQQRVAIARALATEPSLILADEPTGALDTKTGEEIMNLFHDLHSQGITIVTVTHDPEVAAQAQRTIHIRDGVVVL
jgi:putative ABC transport system ATP-binding protein